MNIPEGRIRADCLDITLDPAILAENEPQKLMLYNMFTWLQ